MRLVIAEKPSVAQSLAAVLGATSRKDGYLEGGGWLVSWCLGHLAGLADAAAYNPDYAKWRYDDLPILPESWRFTIAKDKRDQFDVLRTLLRREDVTEVVNACDAGREGELIFRTVYCLAGCQKPMKRLWISSMEDSAIREGFANLRPGADYDGLHQAALCRAKADWLVGINATRLFSVLYHRTLNIGRVMSPTLALIVQREAEIDAFKPVPFYTRTLYVLANTVQQKDWDERFSPANKAWARTVDIPPNPDGFGGERNLDFVVDSHSGLVDLFLSQARQDYLRLQPLTPEEIRAEAARLLQELRAPDTPNSPHGTHYMARVSPDFLARAGTQAHDRLMALLPFRSLAITGMKDLPGTYVTILASEDRSKELRQRRPSVRRQLKQEPRSAEKKAPVRKKQEPER